MMVKRLTYIYILLIFFSAISFNSIAQAPLTKGKEFYFTAPYSNFFNFSVIICADEEVDGTIRTYKPGYPPKNFRIPKESCIVITLSSELVSIADTFPKKQIVVSTSDSVTVYGNVYGIGADDGSIILPYQSTGDKYYMNYYYQKQPNDSFFNAYTIISTQRKNTIHIASDTGNLVVNIDSLGTYSIANVKRIQEMRSISSVNGPFIIFTGGRQSIGECSADNCCYDLLYEQNLPENFLGTEYIVTPFKFGGKEITRIRAIDNGTCISINNGPAITMQEGDAIDTILDEAFFIRSSEKISVAQFLRSNDCSESKLGDPEYMNIFPARHFITHSVFRTPVGHYDEILVNIVTLTSNVSNISLDKNIITEGFVNIPSNPNYSYAQIKLDTGVHTLESAQGFSAFVYGLSGETSSQNSSAFFLGGDDIFVNSVLPSPISFNSDSVFCYGDEAILQGIDEDASYLWQDGSTARTFVTTQPGEYTVQVTQPCFNTTVYDTINVSFAPCDCKVEIPDIFSPNRDKRNDLLIPFIDCYFIHDFQLRIYNRHGFLMFETHDPLTYWDGKFKNEAVMDGIYVYELQYKNESASVRKYGTIAVIK